MRPKTLSVAIFTAALIFAASGLQAACVFMDEDGPWFSGSQYDEDFLQTYPLRQGGSFSLKNVNGIIRISTWDRDDVEVKARKTASRNKEDLDRVRIEVSALPSSVRVDTVHERFRNIRVKVNYEIRVPEGVRLEEIRSTNGDVEIRGLYEEVKAGTTNGDILVEGCDGRVDLSTTNGKIEARDLGGAVTAGTTNGGIVLDLRAVKGDVRARTTNGSITLRLGSDPDAEFQARSTNGGIHVDVPVTVQGTISSRRRLEGRMGSGGPLISLQTTNGPIRVSR